MSSRLVALLLAGLLAAPVLAQQATSRASAAVAAHPSGAGPAWSELPPTQRAALAPLQAHWGRLDAERKSKWIAVAQRFARLPQAERERAQARMTQWAEMSPSERGRARQRYQELRRLPADDRQALWEAYNTLPPEERQALARRAAPEAAPDKAAPRQGASPAPAALAPHPARQPRAPAGEPTVEVGKRSVPVNPQAPSARPVTPSVVQVEPGATTTLVNKTPSPPLHTQPGLPKIAATPGFVDPQTLLPSRGPQGAATIRLAPEPPVARTPITAPVRPRPRHPGVRPDTKAAVGVPSASSAASGTP